MRRFWLSTRVVFLLSLALFVTARFANAQGGATGAIQGDIHDPSGAAVSGAEITLTETGSGVVRNTRSDDRGSFVATLLPAGVYNISVRATGFAPAVAQGVQVRVTETTRLGIDVKPGPVATEVEVQAQVTSVNTTDATTGEAITARTITALPLSTRNFQQLLTLSAGTSSSLNQSASLGRGDVRINVNGQREDNNNYLIDGITASDYNVAELTNTPLPSPDAVGEFRVQTSLYDASQGRNGGGNINAILKSGSSTFHGSGFEFLRNTVLNANEWFLKSQNQPRPDVKQNIFGGGSRRSLPEEARLFLPELPGNAPNQRTFERNDHSNVRAGAAPGPLRAIPGEYILSRQLGLHRKTGPDRLGSVKAAEFSQQPVRELLLFFQIKPGPQGPAASEAHRSSDRSLRLQPCRALPG